MLFRERQLMNSFKPGDWVKYKDQQDTTIYKVINILSNDLIDIGDTIVDKYDIELWQPTVGEWCWFWDENYTTAILAKFENISNGLFVEHHGNIFEYCEPFIGQLPTHLKDQS